MANSNQLGVSLSGITGATSFAGTVSPTFTTPTLGVASGTSLTFNGTSFITQYNNGTWTPTFTFGTPGNLSVSYSAQSGDYVVVGNMCFLTCRFAFIPTFSTSAGSAIINGIPLTASGVSSIDVRGVCGSEGIVFSAGASYLISQITSGANFIQLNAVGSATSISFVTTASFTSGNSYIISIDITMRV